MANLNNGDMSLFQGMRVIESLYLEQDGEPYPVRRTWRERLFGRPWRPFVRMRMIVPRVPHPGAVQLDARTLVMHPVTLRQLRVMSPPAVRRSLLQDTTGEDG